MFPHIYLLFDQNTNSLMYIHVSSLSIVHEAARKDSHEFKTFQPLQSKPKIKHASFTMFRIQPGH